MPRSSMVCVDANIVVRLVTNQQDQTIWDLWSRWDSDGARRIAPALIRYELTNSLYRFGQAAGMPSEDIRALLRTALALDIDVDADEIMHMRALDLAAGLSLSATYDAHYLALAERLGIDFYTGDQRLWNSVRHQLPWVRLVERE